MPPFGDGAVATQGVVGMTLPLVSTVNAVTSGCSASGTFNFNDNGNIAVFAINVLGAVNGVDTFAGAGTNEFAILLPQTSTYTLSLSYSSTSGMTDTEGLGLGTENAPSMNIFQAIDPVSGSSYSGTLAKGQEYFFSEGWKIFNTASPSGNGSASFLLTVSAVPEPSSLCLSAVLGTAVLARRPAGFVTLRPARLCRHAVIRRLGAND